MVGGSGHQMTQSMVLGPLISLSGKEKIVSLLQKPKQEDLYYIKKLIEDNKVKAIIDRTFKLNQVPEAFRYYGNGHAQGKIIITS